MAAAVLVPTNVNYFIPPPDGSRPWFSSEVDPSTGTRKTNISREAFPVNIENVRGREAEYTLDTAGFQFFQHASQFNNFDSEEAVQNEYYPESIDLIKKLTGASKVVLFDHSSSPSVIAER